MIVISNPTEIVNEINIIHALFEESMELFHIRKPDASEEELRCYIAAIDSKYHSKLVLHQHYNLVAEFQLERLHFTEKVRQTISDTYQKPVPFLSTSVHTITDFNNLAESYDYAFIGPIYPSISKTDYKPSQNLLKQTKERNNWKTKWIALGGISAENIVATLTQGFDDVALLGTIWNSTNPIQNFKKCQKIVHTYLP
ncbi:Thiamine phosphate synthase [Flavobacterium sp. 9AF]|uniref:thiamine phosphate synthase n=1 Tax=Flavobacterium sp. 9AF TaxID=2653142 RepID=UPI0012F05426|nr:thiamine phosphate synthase [Flavobacterium sp. 9AF]VXB19365.1 Thiamine phosphate synthase [Flavobacterium sp. 9AF]